MKYNKYKTFNKNFYNKKKNESKNYFFRSLKKDIFYIRSSIKKLLFFDAEYHLKNDLKGKNLTLYLKNGEIEKGNFISDNLFQLKVKQNNEYIFFLKKNIIKMLVN